MVFEYVYMNISTDFLFWKWTVETRNDPENKGVLPL